MKIYHTTVAADWEKFAAQNHYEAPSLATEGFIHASFAEQLEETLRVHFRNAGQVLILEIETEKLTALWLAEKSRGGEDFPHIYGAINKTAIENIVERDLKTNEI